MYKVIEGSNLLEAKGLICHQTNCVGVMGGGVALAIRNKWPTVYNEYKKECKLFLSNPQYLMGHIQDIIVNDKVVIVNCFGQLYPGNGLMTDYTAWNRILDKLRDLHSYYNMPINIPYKIGCGLAGGDWNIMEKKFKDMFEHSSIECIVHKFE